jgi:hypothetical protein
MRLSKKLSLTALLNNHKFISPYKLTSFIGINRRSLRGLVLTFSIKTNNIVDQNTNVTQLKVFLDLFLEDS